LSCMFVSLAMSYNQCGLRPVCCAIDTRAIIFVRRAPFLMIRLTWPMDTKIRFRNTLSTPECDDACPDCEISFSVATGKFSDSFKAGGHRIKHQNSYRRPGLRVVLPRSYNFDQFRQISSVFARAQIFERQYKRFARDQTTRRTRRHCASNSILLLVMRGRGFF